jgi:hypothetical protein
LLRRNLPAAVKYVIPSVTDMPGSVYGYGQRKVYEPPGRQWMSDSETDDVFLVSWYWS